MFGQTIVSSLILAQNEGQLLKIPNVGSVKVQWHLSANINTIKSLYGLLLGANSVHCCIYYKERKVKPIITIESVANIAKLFKKSSLPTNLD